MADLSGLRDLDNAQARMLGVLQAMPVHKPASKGLTDSPRPALPIVLPGGVIPSGKKSWMKGKAYRDSEHGARIEARGLSLQEGTHDVSAMTEAVWVAMQPKPKPGKVVRTNPYEGFVPTPKGTKARKLTPR